MRKRCNYIGIRHSATYIFILFIICSTSFGQLPSAGSIKAINNLKQNSSSQGVFIENIGQYGKTMAGYENMGTIQFGFEGLDMPILFTPKGLIHLQRKVENISHREEELLEKHGIPEEEIERKKNVTDRAITMEWIGADPNVKIVAEEKTTDYHTYGLLTSKAYGYKKIIFKELYPGIDLIYSFTEQPKAGFEYSLLVQPGADLNAVKIKYGGDVKSIKTDNRGNLIIRSDIDGISTSIPVSYYSDKLLNKSSCQTGQVKSIYKIEGEQISFSFPEGYDASKAIVIDPFVTGTGNLPGLNTGKAKDVDFDYNGNIYVTGGGAFSSTHSLAKYDAAGTLQWTFNGMLAIPSWTFGTYYGGWMVEKPSGNVYLGQGFNPTTGFRVIRVSATGLYDNYITTANANFREAWKMFWSCNNGSPQILVAGGGTNANTNFGVFTPPSTTITSLNVTNIPYTPGVGWAQDIADFVFDPANNDMYSIYGSTFGTPFISNRIYKNTAPYSGASIAWNIASGYNTVQEAANRPYLVTSGLSDNSANMLWVNGSYLYYWDGKNLKAFNKATGAGVGTPLTTANTAFMQGGIIADACNNIFVGEGNGVIKVYNFDGNTFNDAPADIPVAGFAGKSVYDLAYDESKKLIYASGDGFVASVDISSYCLTTPFTVNVATNCITGGATATVSPAPPPGSTITYTLFIGNTQVTTNTTGVFTGLIPNTTYTIRATINLACSGSQASTTFVFPGPTINIDAQTNTTCGASTGSITVTGSGGVTPYTYSIDGTNFQPTGTFNGLAAGVYTVTVRDGNGCPNKITVTILNTDGPTLTFTQTNADCGNPAGTVTANATGGTTPYQYSINGGAPYQSGNFFTGLAAGQYILVVRDANNCTNTTIVSITTSPAPSLTAVPASATCNQNNGTITAFGTGGTAPLQYSINGNIFQATNVFTGLAPGAYTVSVKDANGCTKAIPITLGNSPAPTVTAISTPAACSNVNGTVTATGSGGITPYQYSINGTTFQSANVFTGLAPGTYTITIKDNTGCTSIVSVTVASTNGPSVTATTGASLCNTNSGTITVTGTGGVTPYQYSINGTVFQAGATFTGLAPGNYVVYIRDFTGCIGTVPVVVGAVAGPLITAVATPSSCTTNDGTITATGTGGTAPLEYSINGTNYFSTNVFNGLAPGIYTVYVRDANNCVKTTTVTVGNASGLALSVATISASCGSNGIITATATGGTGLLQYSIDGTTYQPGNVFNGLTPGTYTVYVKDANNCIITKQAVVGSATGLTLTATVPQQANCGSANGAIVVVGSGGIAPLTFSIDGTNYQALDTFINVAPGPYMVYVKDATGCMASQAVTVTTTGAGPGISTFTLQTEPAYPCNFTGGRITNPRVNGANCLTCTYSLDFGPFIPHTTQLFLNVPAGVHTVTARDANGCTKTVFVTVPVAVLATATATVIGTACNTTNGSITLTGVGPAPYHASITGIGGPFVTFDPTHTFTGLAPGTYTIIIADDEDFNDVNDPGRCRTTITVIVPSIGGPSIATTQVNSTCNSNNGSITATGSGGVAPYTYNINGGAYIAPGIFNNLAPGVYTVQVRDNTGCITAKTITLTGGLAPAVTARFLSATCNTNNGIITATGTGGTAPLEYSLNGTVFQASNVFTDLAPGAYTVYVKDAGNCFNTTTLTITNTPRVLVTAYTIAATCGNNDGTIVATGSDGVQPYQFSINGTVYQSSNSFAGLAAGFYTVTIKDARDCITTTGVTITNSGAPTINSNAAAATCGNANGSITVTATGGIPPLEYSKDGIAFQAGNSFGSLLPGTYVITVRDGNGCINSRSILVGNINGPQALTASVINEACGRADGSITLTATGGTPPLQYSINGTTYQPGNNFTGVPSGSYTVSVRDNNTCIITLPVTVLHLPGPTLTASSSPASCGLSDGTITAIVTGGTLPLEYSRNGTTFQPSNIFTGLPAGPYTITVRDARNCSATFNINVSTIGGAITPTFAPIGPLCQNATPPALPLTSTNGIAGTWSPATISTATIGSTTYTFTPNTGHCATTATMTIIVSTSITPTFTQVAPICSGGTLNPLPTTSNNGIAGTWSPALNNTATTTYTFTPNTGQCATTATMTITVSTSITPTFTQVAPICSGGALNPLPTTSNNGIAGTWSPALNNTATTTYTFTPNTGQCATTATMTITVSTSITPTFTQVAPICSGGTLNPLPTTSNNGIAGTWSPALNNTATTTYTFTPNTGQCATTATMTITVNASVTPTFTQVAPICSGGALNLLPTTSNNGIAGTWSPALNNTATTTYTFTPNTGQCATTATMTITVNASVTPTFTQVVPICSGGTLNPLPTTSNNGIAGTWSPALNNTATTTYTFTPNTGQCATTATMTITVNAILSPTINCGVSTTSSVSFTWAAVTGATGYTVSYQINANPVVTIGAIGNVLTYSITSLFPGDNVTITLTPTATADACFSAATKTCTATSCTPPTATISYASPFCSLTTTPQAVTLTGTGTFTGGTYSAPTGLSINATTGAITPSTSIPGTYTVTYTIAASGGCPAVTATTSVVISAALTPAFTQIGPLCQNATAPALQATSTNGITGTWNPATISTTTIGSTTYTFTPNTGQCASIATMNIVITNPITPAFSAVAPICSGAALSPLPTTSNNGITGSWSPALNNTATTTYTFTPAAGQCATTTTLDITVNPILSPTINCGVSTSSSVSFTWAAITGATGYTISYQIGTNPVINVGAIGNILTYPVTGLSPGDNVTITVTPTAGTVGCFAAATKSCTATSCSPPTATISYASPFCGSTTTPQAVTIAGTGAYTGGMYSSTTGLSINSTTGAIIPSTSTPGTYTVTYTIAASGGCAAVTATTPVTIDPILSPAINCGVSTSSSVSFTWAAVTGATGYTVSYQIGTNPVINVGAIGNILTYPVTGLSPGDNVTITVTPTAGTVGCFAAATKSCTATSCSPPTATISYTSPFCGSTTAPQAVTLNGTGAYTGGTYSSTIGLSLNSTTGAITPNTSAPGTYTVTYAIAANGGCPAVTATTSVVINAALTPTFTQIGPLCQNATAPVLSATSVNGIAGTWNPATISTTTIGSTIYTFTPNGGQCAGTTTMNIVITTSIVPTFTQIGPLCQNATAPTLPLTSTNGIAGSWNPATISTTTIGSTIYTFTPNAGQCAGTTTMNIVITTSIVPTFTQIGPLCQNTTAPTLPLTSTNGIAGSWNPATISTTTVGSIIYTFTPNAGQCAAPGSLSITVDPLPALPAINIIQPTCIIATGAIFITSTTTGLTFSLDGGAYTAYPAGGYTGVVTGTHTLRAQNAAGCLSAVTSILINASPIQPTVTATATNTTCGNNDGSIAASGTGGTLPYQYSIDGTTFQAGSVFTGLAAGSYTVTIKDANNCTGITSVTIAVFNNLTVTATVNTASCNNNDGSISTSGLGGTAPYQYSIDGVTFQTGNLFSGLSANTYTVTIKDSKNCTNNTTVAISINNTITLNPGNDVTICEGSVVQFTATSNATNFLWTPAVGLSNASILNPIAAPKSTTTYYITARMGICTKTDTIVVFVNPAPIANAGNDATICFGTKLQLIGSGGTIYRWSPSTYLSDPNLFNPILLPLKTGTLVYYLDVVDARGCKSLKKDTLVITVLPPVKVFAGNDTSVTINQPLQLNAIDANNSGFITYTWSPAFGLNNAHIINPVAVLDKIGNYTYKVTARTSAGCEATDDISIKVFIGPDIYMPNAFTPNNDGSNDVLKPILVGIKELKYFSIYHRSGQLVFTTSQDGVGWDGRINGQPQNAGGFVWIAEAIDYNGNVIKRKGAAILVR